MSGLVRVAIVSGAFAVSSLTPVALHAQGSPPAAKAAAVDSMAFPRQFVKWVFSSQGDSAFAHAGPQLRESMKSAEGVNAMASRIQGRFGEKQGTDVEIQFDEGALKVYVVAMQFAQAPETAAWIVAYDPATNVVERASFSPLSNVKSKYPQAKLP